MMMHADEIPTDELLVRRLLQSQFPEWASLPITRVELMGTDNALFRLGDEMVVRLPRRTHTAAPLEKECRWLPRVGPLLPVAVPVPVAQGAPAHGYPLPWAVYTWLPGERATAERITDGRLFTADLAGVLAAMRRIDPVGGPPPGEHNFSRGEPLANRDSATRSAIASLAADIDARRLIAAWDKALEAPRWEHAPVWIHGDLDRQNMLVIDGRLTGLIDFGGLAVGDPACDVMVVWKVLSPEQRDAFRATLTIDDATWSRSRGWAITQAVVALEYYTDATHPVLVREARRWLAEVLR